MCSFHPQAAPPLRKKRREERTLRAFGFLREYFLFSAQGGGEVEDGFFRRGVGIHVEVASALELVVGEGGGSFDGWLDYRGDGFQ